MQLNFRLRAQSWNIQKLEKICNIVKIPLAAGHCDFAYAAQT